MAEKTITRKSTSWGVIVLLILLFWPIGAFLLYRKLSGDKTAVLKNGKIILGVGIALAVFAVLSLLMAASGNLETSDGQIQSVGDILVMDLFFLTGGAVLIYFGRKMQRDGLKYKKYISIVVNNGITSIDEIASAVPCTYEAAVADLQKMIEIGYFSYAYIDSGSRRLVMPGYSSDEENTDDDGMDIVGERPSVPEQKIVTCSSCGARNKVTEGRISECEYCGTPLQ